MTIEELAKFDGREGRPAYVAVSNIVYDLSTSPRWAGGLHEELHQAGQDLTEALKSAPHVRAVVERFPIVGRIEEKTPQSAAGSKFPVLPIIIGGLLLLGLILFFVK